MADHRIVQAKGSFSVRVDGVRHSVRLGDLYHASDPVVTSHPDQFSDVLVRSTSWSGRRPTSVAAVEEATSNPGGRRRMSRRVDEKPATESNDKSDGEV